MRRGGRTLSAIHPPLPCPLTLPVVLLDVALPMVIAVVATLMVVWWWWWWWWWWLIECGSHFAFVNG